MIFYPLFCEIIGYSLPLFCPALALGGEFVWVLSFSQFKHPLLVHIRPRLAHATQQVLEFLGLVWELSQDEPRSRDVKYT